MSSPRATLVLAALLLSLAPGPAGASGERVIVVLGDSLTAGLGVARDEAYPALLEARLRREGFDYRVVNAGVSGDTTAGGLRRLDWVLRAQPDIVLVALGANDGLRAQPVSALRDNLTAIVTRLRAAGARVVLAGMRLPPNYGAAYASAFSEAFGIVARSSSVPLLPFLLEGVAGDAGLNQADGIHPNAAGHRVMAETVWRGLRPLVEKSVLPATSRP